MQGPPDGLVFHLWGWLRVLQREYGRRAVCLAAEDGAGELREMLPLMTTRGLPVGGCGIGGLGNRQPLPTPTTPEELRGGRRQDVQQRLTSAQAALAQRQLRRLDDNLAHRRAVSALYDKLLGERGFCCTTTPEPREPSWVRYPVVVPDRKAAIRQERRYVVLGTWFTSVLQESADAVQAGSEPGSCPQAERAARHLVNLPTHPRVQVQDALAITVALAAAQD